MIEISGTKGVHHIDPAHVVHMIHYKAGGSLGRISDYELRLSNGDVIFVGKEEYEAVLSAKGVQINNGSA